MVVVDPDRVIGFVDFKDSLAHQAVRFDVVFKELISVQHDRREIKEERPKYRVAKSVIEVVFHFGRKGNQVHVNAILLYYG